MKKYNYYTDANFLGGHLTIIVDPEQGITTADFHYFKYPDDEEPQQISTSARVRKGDTFNEVIGIDVVKMKVSKMYYETMKKDAKAAIDTAKKILKNAQMDYDFANRKISNIKNALVQDGFTYYNIPAKPVETVVEKQVPTKRKPIKIITDDITVKPVKQTATKKAPTVKKTATVKKATSTKKATTEDKKTTAAKKTSTAKTAKTAK